MALRIFRLIKNTLEIIAESSLVFFFFSFLSHVFITHLLHILAGRRFNICIFHLLLKTVTVSDNFLILFYQFLSTNLFSHTYNNGKRRTNNEIDAYSNLFILRTVLGNSRS